MKRLTFALLFITSTLPTACSGTANSLHTAAPSARNGTASKASQSEVSWPVWGFDPGRSNFNSAEQSLTIGNVAQLHEQWQTNLGAFPVSASPILVVGDRPSKQTMLFATAKNGVTFALDATTGQIIWKFATHGGKKTTSAPAADPSGTWIYAPGVDAKVHKLAASNGSESVSGGFPVVISLMPKTELDESPLNVANGYLYAVLGGAGNDQPPYDGHVVSVNLGSGQAAIFNSLCSEYHALLGATSCGPQRSGIWARAGAVVDPDPSMGGRIYAATGNGDFNANNGGYDYGDSVLALAPDLSSMLSSYTPSDYLQLDDRNEDLGSTSPAVLPKQANSSTPYMLVQGGKDGVLRLMNRAPLPGVGGELQLVQLRRPLYATPAVWTDPNNQAWIFLVFPQKVYAYRLNTNASGVSLLQLQWSAFVGQTQRGTSPVVANGILFVAFNNALVALNATTGAKLWSSDMPSAGLSIGPVHFESPIVVNGWVYCSDDSNNITAYALYPSRRRR
ncbi:MAG TPA: PQQ-binding-like beta-propeller repeat protein [Candidatus Nitrosotalea sp.]|nr:PQQ-binding-like beta-propeller repeat protein [Candidatus Nitrosotalea sp.]